MARQGGSPKGSRTTKGRSVAAREDDAPAPLPKAKHRIPPQGRLRELAALKLQTKTKVAKLNGTYAEQCGELVEKGLNKRAWAIAMSLHQREPEELAEIIPHLDHYLEILKIRERADSAPGFDLSDDDGSEAGDQGESEPARRTAEVRPFPAPKGEAAE